MSSKASNRRVPVELRRRTEYSCDRCKSRKQKCDRSRSSVEAKCQHCLKHGYDCVVTKLRKQRLYGSVEGHGSRIAVLESLVKGLIPEIDLSNVERMQETGRSLGIPLLSSAHDDASVAVAAAAASPASSGDAGPRDLDKENEHLVHDQRGHGQYIGRASSYFFQMTLRSLVGNFKGLDSMNGQMILFGNQIVSRDRPHLAGTPAGRSRVIRRRVHHTGNRITTC